MSQESGLADPLDQLDDDADLPEQMRIRREKLERLTASGQEAYPAGYPRTISVAELRERFPDLPPGAATGETVGVTGRVMLSRNTGKLCFATIQEWDAPGPGDALARPRRRRTGSRTGSPTSTSVTRSV